jgi:septal ring-binding cell division protein DamX
MDIFEQLDPQAILVLLMVIFAAIKAFFEQRKKVGSEETLEEETNLDLYQAYEEEVARQRKELQIELSPSSLSLQLPLLCSATLSLFPVLTRRYHHLSLRSPSYPN